MIVGLIQSGTISLTAWTPYVQSRATYAQSTVRRFRRWLDNERIHVHALYGPLIRQALAEWGQHRLYLALDTTMLWHRYCVIRMSVIYRGRAIPVVWRVFEHASSSVAYADYADLLDQTVSLLPLYCDIVLLADHGFVDTDLMAHAPQLGWHWHIRIKSSFWIHRRGRRGCKVNRITLAKGEARFWHNIAITQQHAERGPVHLAIGRPTDGGDQWLIVSDEPTGLHTFDEYGLRFDIEENFLDDTPSGRNGFQLESSLIRSVHALERLGFVLAITTLYLVAQGTQIVDDGQRRFVDAHWFRGNSYLKIGWQWIKRALVMGYALITTLRLSGEPDPEPAMASRLQHRQNTTPAFHIVHVTEFA